MINDCGSTAFEIKLANDYAQAYQTIENHSTQINDIIKYIQNIDTKILQVKEYIQSNEQSTLRAFDALIQKIDAKDKQPSKIDEDALNKLKNDSISKIFDATYKKLESFCDSYFNKRCEEVYEKLESKCELYIKKLHANTYEKLERQCDSCINEKIKHVIQEYKNITQKNKGPNSIQLSTPSVNIFSQPEIPNKNAKLDVQPINYSRIYHEEVKAYNEPESNPKLLPIPVLPSFKRQPKEERSPIKSSPIKDGISVGIISHILKGTTIDYAFTLKVIAIENDSILATDYEQDIILSLVNDSINFQKNDILKIKRYSVNSDKMILNLIEYIVMKSQQIDILQYMNIAALLNLAEGAFINITAEVKEINPLTPYNNQTGPGTFIRFTLADQSGSIDAVAFGAKSKYVEAILKRNQLYKFENCKLNYNKLKKKKQLVIEEKTVITS